MSAEQESGALSAERQQARERAIERQIMQRTWGRIQALEVKVSHDLVIVRGRAQLLRRATRAAGGPRPDRVRRHDADRTEHPGGPPPKWVREALESCVAAGDGVTPIRHDRRSAT